MKRVSCLILDLGGVLTEDQDQARVDEMMTLLGLSAASEAARESFVASYWKRRTDYDRGLYGAAEYWGRIASDLGLDPARRLSRRLDLDDRLGRLVDADLRSWFTMRPAMTDFLRGAKGRVRTLVMLSNINEDGARYVREGGGRAWSGLFDELVLSCEHRLLKPEPEIYALALGRAGARADEALFVDDNPDNVRGALNAGLSSFRFEGAEDFRLKLARDYELAPGLRD